MSDVAKRPTTDVSDVILHSMDGMVGQLTGRLAGLGRLEYLWEPVAGMWSIRPSSDGGPPVVEGAGIRAIDPAPMTTIAWRLWHLSLDCFDDYTRRFAGDLSDASAEWTFEPGEALATLDEKWAAFRSTLAARDWWKELGADWGPFSSHCVADIAMHASNELVHHAAEIALLRDLYANQA